MPVKKVDKIWMNGKFVNWDDAKIHVLSHVVHYGTSWFEGIRCYETGAGPAIFRLDRHVRRLFDSVKIYRTEIPYTEEQIREAIVEVIRVNKMRACYVRPVVYRGYGDVGVNPVSCPVDVSIAVWEWGAYLGAEALSEGIDVCVSTWNRPAPNTLPAMSKAGGNYILSQLMKLEAITAGFKEAIALDVNGQVSEGKPVRRQRRNRLHTWAVGLASPRYHAPLGDTAGSGTGIRDERSDNAARVSVYCR